MTSSQECKLSMSVGTINFLDKNASITSILPGYEPLITRFRLNIYQITILRDQQEVDTSGIRDNKELLRVGLAALAYDISRKTEAYASFANNLILVKEVHFAETSLTKATDTNLASRAQIIYEKASANMTDLIPYGVTEDDLIALKNAGDLFRAAVPSTRTGSTEKKLITDKIARLIKENDAILEKIDLLIEIVRLSQPDFYKGYKDNRMIIKTGKGSLALIASATDSVTGEVCKGVKFTFIYQNGNGAIARSAEPLVKITSKRGRFNVKNMAEGPYNVHVEKPGLKSQELHINKAAGDRLKLNVKLEKI